VVALLARADINVAVGKGVMAHHLAAMMNGCFEILRALLAARADVKKRGYVGMTALNLATVNKTECMSVLQES